MPEQTEPDGTARRAALFGDIRLEPFSRINQIVARRMAESWKAIPHVTHFDAVDLKALQALTEKHTHEAQRAGFKLTWLPFVIKTCADVLAAHPRLNASINDAGDGLILKDYVNIGFAVDTPAGLMRPVIKRIDQKPWLEIAAEMNELADRSRSGRLPFEDAEGASFSITSLGRIGGHGFTPIINVPEVAILGISRAEPRARARPDGSFEHAMMLPLSLSYDHRVVDGAAAGRFMGDLIAGLEASG